MCGILGYVGTRDGRQVIRAGLGRLEYRGYDSAGVALCTGEGLAIEKVAGRVETLDLDKLPLTSHGIGHTRWATHGAPSVDNAHPHLSCDAKIAVVHNGVITNEQALKHALLERGHTLVSQTDTEVIAHLAEEAYAQTGELVEATRRTEAQLEGSYAFVVLHQDHPGELVAARNESPLVLGVGDDECFVASDVVAFLEHTDRAVFLHDGDLVHVRDGAFQVLGREHVPIERIPWGLEEASLAGFDHFMLKEMHEQPRALRQALVGRVEPGELPLEGTLDRDRLAAATDLHLLACGSSYNAALLASHLLEATLDVPTRSHIGSEVHQSGPVTASRPLFLTVTQSGETADTLEAVRSVRRLGHDVLALTNVVGSSVTREATAWMPLRAGPELSVAATKSFTSQALVLGLLAAQLGWLKGHRKRSQQLLEGLRSVPHAVQQVLDNEARYREAGTQLAQAERCFVLGSGPSLPVAMETALKIKEISYIHAEAFPTGELKIGRAHV